MILKIPNKNIWVLKNKSGTKTLGTYPTKEAAERREKQVLYFKNKS